MKIIDEDMGLNEWIDKVQSQNLSKMEVGVLQKGGSKPHAGTLKERGKKISIAQVAANNEFGVGVPQRPFLSSTIDNVSVTSVMFRVIERIIAKTESPELALIGAGKHLKASIKDAIRSWRSPPNSPQWAGFKGKNDPLVWTGQLMNSINFEIKKSLKNKVDQ